MRKVYHSAFSVRISLSGPCDFYRILNKCELLVYECRRNLWQHKNSITVVKYSIVPHFLRIAVHTVAGVNSCEYLEWLAFQWAQICIPFTWFVISRWKYSRNKNYVLISIFFYARNFIGIQFVHRNRNQNPIQINHNINFWIGIWFA